MHSQNDKQPTYAMAQAGKQVGTLSRQQKYALVFLCLFALVIIGAGLGNFKKVLKSSDIKVAQQEIPTDEVVADSQNLASANKTDTDKDGLTDYDERNIYSTSPYLPDTDGDGANDGDEVKGGSDPICATGQNCANTNPVTNQNWSGAASSAGEVSAGVPSGLSAEQLEQMKAVQQLVESAGRAQNTGQAVNNNDAPPSANAMVGEAGAQAILSGQADAATLRASLISSGVPKEDLDKISDDILLKNYSELLAQQKK